jgi:Large polyvalent protein-associated domain 7
MSDGERKAVEGGDEIADLMRKGRSAKRGDHQLPAKEARAQLDSLAEGVELNSIRPARIRSRSRTGARASESEPLEADPSVQGLSPGPQTTAAQSEQDHWTVPQKVGDHFIPRGGGYYFPDGRLAFRDHGRKLSTSSEGPDVIVALIEIARARAWQEIALEGTGCFCREAWRQGRIAGFDVRGYKASAAEYAATRRDSSGKDESQYTSDPSAPAPGRPEAEASVHEGAPVAQSQAGRSTDELIGGKLVAHGRAAYRFNSREEPSYFVRILTGDGQRTIWGRDLETAIEQSVTKPKIGDEIGLRRLRSSSLGAKPSESAPVPRESEAPTRRHYWVVEKRAFFQARAQAAQTLRDVAIKPVEAVRRHPELAGSYLNLHAAELVARSFRDPRDRTTFVEEVRKMLAESIARGAPWPRARLRVSVDGHPNLERGHPPVAAEPMTR